MVLRPSFSGMVGCLCVTAVIVGIILALIASGRRKDSDD
jgi:hypothetical protein